MGCHEIPNACVTIIVRGNTTVSLFSRLPILWKGKDTQHASGD